MEKAEPDIIRLLGSDVSKFIEDNDGIQREKNPGGYFHIIDDSRKETGLWFTDQSAANENSRRCMSVKSHNSYREYNINATSYSVRVSDESEGVKNVKSIPRRCTSVKSRDNYRVKDTSDSCSLSDKSEGGKNIH